MKKVMVRAWNLARLAVKKFGGKAKDYFSQALTVAWEEVKSIKTTIEETILNAHQSVLEANGAGSSYVSHTIKYWKGGRNKRVYFNLKVNNDKPVSIYIDVNTGEVVAPSGWVVCSSAIGKAEDAYVDAIKDNVQAFIAKYAQ